MLRPITAAALLCLIFGCSGGPDPDAEAECAHVIERYSKLYIEKFGDHKNRAFDEIVEMGHIHKSHATEGSCRTVLGLAELIERDRGLLPPTESLESLQPNAQPARAKHILGAVICVLGTIVSLVAGIWFLVVAFSESVLWGLGILFLPMANVVFAAMHWEKAKPAFLAHMAGVVIVIFGILLML